MGQNMIFWELEVQSSQAVKLWIVEAISLFDNVISIKISYAHRQHQWIFQPKIFLVRYKILCICMLQFHCSDIVYKCEINLDALIMYYVPVVKTY